MSWLFGKKKYQKDSPPESTEEEQASDQTEAFVLIDKMPAPVPPHMMQNAAAYPSGNLYPYIPPVPKYLADLPTDPSKDHNQRDDAHYLNGIPFKLSKQLENSMSNNWEIDELRISEILTFIENIERQNYDYSFSVEEGVVAEMNSRSDE